MAGLQKHDEGQVCSAAIGVLVDLCRALETGLMPHLDEFMSLLFQIVQVSSMARGERKMIMVSSTFDMRVVE